MDKPPEPPHEELTRRPFSFYPPIVGIDHNEWRLEKAAWSEMIVRNTKTGLELGIPRRYFGEVSQVDEPVMIVGLLRELEYRMGAVWPYERKVLAMGSSPSPAARRPEGEQGQSAEPHGLEAIVGTGLSGTESRISRLILWTFLTVVVAGGLFWALVRFTPEAKPSFVAKDQDYLTLNRDDDYFAVVRKLGQPSGDRWRSATGELQYRGLVYRDRAYMVILMGTDRDSARYIGTMYIGRDGREWKPLHAVEFARGTSTLSMLRNMPRF
jgi:hypothetical protein